MNLKLKKTAYRYLKVARHRPTIKNAVCNDIGIKNKMVRSSESGRQNSNALALLNAEN